MNANYLQHNFTSARKATNAINTYQTTDSYFAKSVQKTTKMSFATFLTLVFRATKIMWRATVKNSLNVLINTFFATTAQETTKTQIATKSTIVNSVYSLWTAIIWVKKTFSETNICANCAQTLASKTKMYILRDVRCALDTQTTRKRVICKTRVMTQKSFALPARTWFTATSAFWITRALNATELEF